MSSPPSRNSYLEYKRDTAQLIRWIVTTASNISQKPKQNVSSEAPQPVPKPRNSKPQTVKINSPEITVASLLTCSELISSSAKSVPPMVYNLFSSVIRARTAAYQFWHSIYTSDLDEDVKKSNEAHKAFIDALQAAYEVLGGVDWEERRAEERGSRQKDEEIEEPLANRFEGLEIDELSSEEEAEEVPEKPGNAPQRIQRKNKKGKGKGKGKKKAAAPAPKPQNWPLEDFKLKDDPGSETEAVFAAFCFLQDMMKLRRYTSDLWRQVAREELHVAIAGALSNVVVARIKQLQYDAAADFPQLNSFETILHTLCRGNLDSAAGKLKVVTSGPLGNLETTTLDFREYFSVYAYNDLVNFIMDYRKNRNGKPSPTYASLEWDPDIKLSQLSAKKRREWRSDYSMLWLYDIVNSYASSILTALSKGVPGTNLETWDWSMQNMGRKSRRMLWGPVEFVGEVTALAMKRKDAPLSKLLKPHLVFQIQIMLDSMTAFKGWSFDLMLGGRVGPEAPWSIAYSEVESFHKKFIGGATGLMKEYEADQQRYEDPRRHDYPLEEIPKIVTEVQLVLGDSMLSRATGAPDSRFEYVNRNGMWVFNPWLCGTGLTEALNFVFEFGITSWDKSGAALCIFHLYNMLLVTGHLPGGKLTILEDLLTVFESQVFRGEKRPKKDFYGAWMVAAGVKAQVLGDPRKKRLTKGGNILESGERLASLYRRAEVRCFNEKSLLRHLQEADWIPEKLPREKIPSPLVPKHTATGKKNIQQDLIEAMKKSGIVAAESEFQVPQQERQTDDELLCALRRALLYDVTGEVPFAALNLLPLLGYIMQVFEHLDEATKHFPRPLGEPVGPRTAHNSVMKLALDLEVAKEQLSANGVLEEMGKVLEETVRGVELGDFTFWDYVVEDVV